MVVWLDFQQLGPVLFNSRDPRLSDVQAVQFVLLLSRQGKVRLSKWYSTYTQKERAKVCLPLLADIRSSVICQMQQGFLAGYQRCDSHGPEQGS